LRGTILNVRRLGFRGRLNFESGLSFESRGEFGGSHLSGREVLPQFQTQIPHPWAEDLPKFLATRGV